MSITFGVVFLWVLISSIIQGILDDYYIIIFSGFLASVLIAGITFLCINTKWKKIGKSIPNKVSISGDCIYITNYNNDTKSYPYSEMQKLTMTPIKGGTDGFRRIIINCSDTQDTYCFGFVADREKVFPQYPEMFLDLRERLQEKFLYETK